MLIVKLDQQLLRKINRFGFSFRRQNSVESQRHKYACAQWMSHARGACYLIWWWIMVFQWGLLDWVVESGGLRGLVIWILAQFSDCCVAVFLLALGWVGARLGGRLGFGRGCSWCRVFMGPLGIVVGGLPIWPGAVLSRRPFVCHGNAFVVDIRFYF